MLTIQLLRSSDRQQLPKQRLLLSFTHGWSKLRETDDLGRATFEIPSSGDCTVYVNGKPCFQGDVSGTIVLFVHDVTEIQTAVPEAVDPAGQKEYAAVIMDNPLPTLEERFSENYAA